jgi:hypothetical protein
VLLIQLAMLFSVSPAFARAVVFPAAWGSDYDGSTVIPPDLTNAVQVQAGADTTLVVKSDGTILAWGHTNSFNITNVPPAATNIGAISVTQSRVLALRRDGSVIAWGDGSYGTTNIPAGVSNVMAVACGLTHNVVLFTNGTVFCWGNNWLTLVPPGLSGVVSIAAGSQHSLALRADGTVVAWGGGEATNVPAGLSGVSRIAAGAYDSYALLTNGSLIAWGTGATNVPAGLSNVIAMAGGFITCYAATSDGKLIGWGNAKSPPVGLTNVFSLSAGLNHAIGLNDGTPYIVSQPNSFYDNYPLYSGSTKIMSVTASGYPTLGYQWQKNGLNIPGATGASFSITNVQFSDNGAYRAVVTNLAGTSVSSNVLVNVSNSAPLLAFFSAPQQVIPGRTVYLNVLATGSQPIAYQWRLEGTNLPGVTATSITLTNVQQVNDGNYSVVITNAFGSLITTNSFLNVLNLSEVINSNSIMSWTTTGDAPWFPGMDVLGYVAAHSGPITNSQTSTLQTVVNGPGFLSFSWWADCQPNADYLSLAFNGVEQTRISSVRYPTTTNYYLPSGALTLTWTFVRGPSGSYGQNAGFLNNLTFVPGGVAPTITAQPANIKVATGAAALFKVVAGGTPPMSYQWMLNGTNVSGATGTSLALANVSHAIEGVYAVAITNAYGYAVSANAELKITDSFLVPGAPFPLAQWYYRDTNVPYRVRFARDRFIGVGPNGLLVTSKDGRTWSKQNSGTTNLLRSVTIGTNSYGQPLFIAVGSSVICQSTDGTNWVATSTSSDLNDIAWSSNIFRFVATVARTSLANYDAYYSNDGTNWTAVTFPATNSYGSYSTGPIIFAQGTFIAASAVPFDFWRSVNGRTWTYSGYSDQYPEGMAYGNGEIILVGEESRPYVSTNLGVTWFPTPDTVSFPDFSNVGTDLSFGNGLFVAARGQLGVNLPITSDGISWQMPPIPVVLTSVAYGNGTFVGVVSGGSYPLGIYQTDTAIPARLTATTVSNAIQLSLSGEFGRTYRIQTSSNLVNWADWTNVNASLAPIVISDQVLGNRKQLFYRAVTP